MEYNYNGDLCFSRELTEEELDEVVSIIGFTDNEVNVEFDNNSISIDASQHGGRTYEFCTDLPKWCEKHNVKLTPDTCIRYVGDNDGAFYMDDDGRMADHDNDEYYIWAASSDRLIDELKRRGIWQKRQHLIDIGAGYIRNDMEAAEPDYVRGVLNSLGATDEDLRELGLHELINN